MLMEAVAGRFQKVAGQIAQAFTGLGSTRIAQTEAEGDEMSRAGLRYILGGPGATGIAPVQAIPSTAAQWLIWNPNGNPMTAFVDVLGMLLVSGTAGAGATFYGCPVGPSFAPSTVPTINAAGLLLANANPASGRVSKLIVASAQTLLNAAVGNWTPLGFMNPANTVLGQTQMENRDIRGKMIIPPGCGLALAVVSPTGTTPLFAPYGVWHEQTSDNE